MIVDEAAHVDPDLFFKVIAPILQLRNTALLALSSPEGDSNYYSQFISMAEGEEGEEPLFKVVDCILMCDECKKLERAEAVKCNHVKQDAPWLSARHTNKLKRLYKNNPALYAREMLGMIVSDYKPCFRQQDVEVCFNLEHVNLRSSPPYLFTAVDPNGGGPSHMAMCTGYFDAEGNLVVCQTNRVLFQCGCGPIMYSCRACCTKPFNSRAIPYLLLA